MRIGLPGLGNTIDKIVNQAQRAEADGFCALWYTSGTLNDPLIAMTLAGRATTRIELGTAIANTYACHPVLLASRAAAAVEGIGSPGRFTLGVGPSHQPFVEGMLGLAYDHPGRHTEEYLNVLAPLLRGEAVSFDGEELPLPVNAGPPSLLDDRAVPLLVAALGPRLLRIAGELADGTIPWMANATALERHITPTITKAAANAGRPAPRIVAGLPVAVHDDRGEARSAAQTQFGIYGQLVNYQRVFERGNIAGPAEAAIVGDEASVTRQVHELFDAGATEVWLAGFAVGDDHAASRARTRRLLVELANGYVSRRARIGREEPHLAGRPVGDLNEPLAETPPTLSGNEQMGGATSARDDTASTVVDVRVPRRSGTQTVPGAVCACPFVRVLECASPARQTG